jgi:hypothetical protein
MLFQLTRERTLTFRADHFALTIGMLAVCADEFTFSIHDETLL